MCSGWCNNWVTRQHARCNNENTLMFVEKRITFFSENYKNIMQAKAIIFRSVSKIEKIDCYLTMAGCLSVYPSYARRTSAPIGTIFMKFYVWGLFENLPKKIWMSLKSDKNNWYFTWRPMYIYDSTNMNFLSMRNVSYEIVEKIKTHIFIYLSI